MRWFVRGVRSWQGPPGLVDDAQLNHVLDCLFEEGDENKRYCRMDDELRVEGKV